MTKIFKSELHTKMSGNLLISSPPCHCVCCIRHTFIVDQKSGGEGVKTHLINKKEKKNNLIDENT